MAASVTARTRFKLLLAALGVFAMAAVAVPRSAAPLPAVAGVLPCTNGTTFNLRAATGRISTPDGSSVFMWGFAKNPGAFQMPGPILCVTQGSTVTVNLQNDLSEPVSIVFPGQTGVSASGGAPGLLAREAAASGGTVSYSFVASEPGTYLYESGTSPHKQVQMGLYGALVVRPDHGRRLRVQRRCDAVRPGSRVPPAHARHRSGAAPRRRAKRAVRHHDEARPYWTINGRSFPDTIAGDGVAYLPSQPYGALVRVRPATGSSLPALIRMANAGMSNHPFHPHGNHVRVIAQDGRLLGSGASLSYEQFTQTAGSGQTFDLLFKWTNVENWSITHPVPVTLPLMRNLVFKDKVTWYSGSPYLGRKVTLPAGTVSHNRCGEYYYPWHSHALNEFQNFDEGFGGLATLLRVDPPVGQGTPPSCPGP